MKLRELAERLACQLEGDGEIDVAGVAAIQDAGPSDVTFVANPKYASAVATTRAAAVIARPDVSAGRSAMLRTDEPYLAFARAVGLFAPVWRPAAGIHPLTSIAGDARIGRDVSIGPFVAIGEGARIGDRSVIFANVTIGAGATVGAECILHSNVSVRERVTIGDRVILQNGVVVGSDGYGFVRRADGTHEKIPQVATVVVEDDVELGANTTVDRPAVGETRIGAGTKIDNLVQVAHGVKLGKGVLLAAQVGIAGSTKVEDNVTLAGQVGVAGHLTIGAGVVATAQTGIPNSVDAGKTISGYPAIDNRDWLRSSAVFRRLPELKKAVSDLQRRLEDLEQRLKP
jgi:UDP-3-O-[3-hydroxymyristoyl] glucosamine N-acyltransferase